MEGSIRSRLAVVHVVLHGCNADVHDMGLSQVHSEKSDLSNSINAVSWFGEDGGAVPKALLEGLERQESTQGHAKLDGLYILFSPQLNGITSC